MKILVDRFRDWAGSEDGKKYFAEKIKRYNSRSWVEGQFRLMCDWLADNPERQYRNWARFAGGWLRRSYAKRVDDIENSQCPGLMTADQEQNYYAKKRRTESREPIPIGDIMKEIEKNVRE